MATTDDLLDLVGIGQRTSTWRFDVLDDSLNVTGSFHPAVSPPTVSNDTTRPIMRTLDGLVLPPGVIDDLNLLADRVRPVMLLENGAQEPCGVFMFADSSSALSTGGDTVTASLVDQSLILDQPVSDPFIVKAGTSATAAITALLAGSSVGWNSTVEASGFLAGEDLVYPAGTSRLEAINAIGKLAGYFPLYFDRNGAAVVRLVPDLASVDPTFEIVAGRFLADSAVVSDGALVAPNRYLAVESGSSDAPVVGVWDVPATAPNSSYNRGGLVVAKQFSAQGLGTQAAADAAAKAFGQIDQASYTKVSYSTPPDPRHDSFDVSSFLGVTYLEVGWSMPLLEGEAMTHDLRLVYT